MKSGLLVFFLLMATAIGFNIGKESAKDQEAVTALSKERAIAMTYFTACLHQLGDPELIDRPEQNPLSLIYSQECYIKAEIVGKVMEKLKLENPNMSDLEILDKAISTVKPEKVEPVDQPTIEFYIQEEKPDLWI